MKKSAHHDPVRHLALRVREVAQLFHSMDPTPFLNKDLDPEAERFIESWASEFSPASRFHITIHLEQWPSDGDPVEMLGGAIRNHFAYKAERTRSDLKHFLWQGRVSLLIGWVAMWRPMQIFLYDWWPLQRQIRLYEKLGSAQVQVIQGR